MLDRSEYYVRTCNGSREITEETYKGLMDSGDKFNHRYTITKNVRFEVSNGICYKLATLSITFD